MSPYNRNDRKRKGRPPGGRRAGGLESNPIVAGDATGDITMNQPTTHSRIFAKLREILRECAWSILELHHRLFGAPVDPSLIPEKLNLNEDTPKGPLGPSA